MDISVQVLGQPSLLSAIQESLEGASSALTSLQFWPVLSDPCLLHSSASPPTQPMCTSMSVPSTTHSLSLSTCTSVSDPSSSSSVYVSPSSPEFLDELFSPWTLSSRRTPSSVHASSSPSSSISLSSLMDELFSPWMLRSESTPSASTSVSLSSSVSSSSSLLLDELFE